MIDTDKYEGHTEGMWIVEGGSVYLQDEVTPIARMDRDTNHTTPTERDSNARLIADAPLLLAEVKRLRSIADDLYAYIVTDTDIEVVLGVLKYLRNGGKRND